MWFLDIGTTTIERVPHPCVIVTYETIIIFSFWECVGLQDFDPVFCPEMTSERLRVYVKEMHSLVDLRMSVSRASIVIVIENPWALNDRHLA